MSNKSKPTLKDLPQLKYFALTLVIILGGLYFWNNSKKESDSTSTSSSIIDTVAIDQKFSVNGISAITKGPQGVELAFTKAELKSQIKYKDKPLTPGEGKAFLLIRAEIKNDASNKIAIATGDFIRLKSDGKLFAPDYHNGAILIEPISTRPDQVVFVVSETLKEFDFSIGDPSGERVDLKITF